MKRTTDLVTKNYHSEVKPNLTKQTFLIFSIHPKQLIKSKNQSLQGSRAEV